jgi:hypothetical protein
VNLGSGKLKFRFNEGEPWTEVDVTSIDIKLPPHCPWCLEPILPGEPVLPCVRDGLPCDYHEECMIRAGFGSVAHQLKVCSCFLPGAEAHEDPPDMSKRAAAKLAFDYFTLQYER